MANTKKFVAKNGLWTKNIEVVSPDGTQSAVLTHLDTGELTLDAATKVINLDADKLDGQEGTYYLDWGNLTGKPTTINGYGITDALTLGSTEGSEAGTAAAGNATTAARSDHVHPPQTTVSGNAGTATKLQTARTINGVSFDGSANITINAVDSTARIASSEKGVANGVATLDASGLVHTSQLPSYVDDVLEYAAQANFPATGESAKIYVALDTNKIYRWSGSAYIEISPTAGNADTATKLATARTLTIGGTGKSFDGSANVSWTLAELGAVASNAAITEGTATKITYDAKGLVTAGTTLAASDIPNLDTSKLTSGTLAVARGGTGAETTNGATVFAGPVANTGAPTAAAPSFRNLQMSDMPDATFKKSVRVATTAALTLNAATTTIDGVTITASDRILIKNQATPSQNGIYYDVTTTLWKRCVDADTASEIASSIVAVDSGTINGGKKFATEFKTTDTLGTTAMYWHEIATARTAIMSPELYYFMGPRGM